MPATALLVPIRSSARPSRANAGAAALPSAGGLVPVSFCSSLAVRSTCDNVSGMSLRDTAIVSLSFSTAAGNCASSDSAPFHIRLIATAPPTITTAMITTDAVRAPECPWRAVRHGPGGPAGAAGSPRRASRTVDAASLIARSALTPADRPIRMSALWPAAPAEQAHDQGHQEQHGEDEEQDLGDLGRTGGNAAETEERRDQRDDEKYERVVKHVVAPFDPRSLYELQEDPQPWSGAGLAGRSCGIRVGPRYRHASFSAVGASDVPVGCHNLRDGDRDAKKASPWGAKPRLGHRPTLERHAAYARNRPFPIAVGGALCHDGCWQSREGAGFMIRKLKSGEYRLFSVKRDPKTGRRRNLGTFRTREEAKQRERQVQYFKHHH